MANATVQDQPVRIGIPYLQELWARVCLASGGPPKADGHEADGAVWARDQLVIDGLGLARHETYAFLHSQRPDFEAFEAWIADRAEHLHDPGRIAWINAHLAALDGTVPAPELQPPVLGAPVLDTEALEFWDEHGYVVLRGAVPQALCQAAEAAIWDFTGGDPGDPQSWYDGGYEQGIMLPLFHHPAFSAVRQVPAIRQAFAQLWGTSDLLATTDRGGFNPPERAGWRFSAAGLHWDLSLAPPMPLDVQGLVYLADTPAHQGAFRCVPGFHRRLGPWLDALPPGSDPRRQPLDGEAEPIAGSAGDLVLWHAGLPHGASPNRGTRPRMVLYIAMRPPGFVDRRPWV